MTGLQGMNEGQEMNLDPGVSLVVGCCRYATPCSWLWERGPREKAPKNGSHPLRPTVA